ncbi:hypothetical protein IG631_18684 [Alternaria alternata]|nr:hypothetical protein IG631_18684 [Alternaria alternata]
MSPSPLIAPSPLQKSCCNLARLQSSPSASHPCLLHTATAAAACNSRAKQAAITLITTAGRGEDKGNRRPDARPRPSFRHGSRCLFYQAPLRILAKLLLQLPDAAPTAGAQSSPQPVTAPTELAPAVASALVAACFQLSKHCQTSCSFKPAPSPTRAVLKLPP